VIVPEAMMTEPATVLTVPVTLPVAPANLSAGLRLLRARQAQPPKASQRRRIDHDLALFSFVEVGENVPPADSRPVDAGALASGRGIQACPLEPAEAHWGYLALREPLCPLPVERPGHHARLAARDAAIDGDVAAGQVDQPPGLLVSERL
jgi:hypothetical protein